MTSFECGGEVIQTIGSVRMTKKDSSLIIFRGIPLNQCRQCGEHSTFRGNGLKRLAKRCDRKTIWCPTRRFQCR